MMPVDSTHRQSRLAEVGAAGQARIAAAAVDVRLDGVASVVCVRYLAGCGVGTLRVRDSNLISIARAVSPHITVVVVDDLPRNDAAPRLDLHDPVAREIALGANEALRIVRATIGLHPGGDTRDIVQETPES
jgi:hypothetical protein